MKRLSPVQIRIALTAVLLLVVVAALLLLSQPPGTQGGTQSTPSGQSMALDPAIISNLTSIPQATPLSGQDANDMVALGEMVKACDAYTPERRDQMLLQIDLIVNPAAMPRDVIIGLGANPRARLLMAIGGVTGIQWRLDDQLADSCLVPIGKRINELIVAAGGTPVAVFEDNA